MSTDTLTQSRLHELFEYDGRDLIWKIDKGTVKKGDRVKCTRPDGYLCVGIDGTKHLVHRAIWLYVTGNQPEFEIDHRNGVKGDNRICNLRDVTPSINQRNQKKKRTNTSGITGVAWNKKTAKWTAWMSIDRKTIYLGQFDCKYRAASARCLGIEIEGGYTNRHGA